MAQRAKTSHFRGDIQGLRAVAVLVVFADHLFGWPAGGFIGVDVFFVISGFLITGLLVREFERTGGISFRGFYSRRARRILPAAVVTLAITVGCSFALFPASKANSVLWDGVASFFFVGNWRFAATGTDYFAAGDPSALQHFWSLSVEEQFYFVWPWLMLGILIIGTRLVKGSIEGAVRATGMVMLGVVAFSFVIASVQSAYAPTEAYFSTVTRVWELGIGASLAIFSPTFARLPMLVRTLLSWGGLLIVGLGLFMITPQSGFPAPWALIPVVGSALVLAAGIGTEPRLNYVLDNPVARYIGDISYSLYLWHFPVIILGTAMFPERSIWYFLGASLVGIILAVLSFELIERPLLASPWLRPRVKSQTRSDAWSRWRAEQRDRVRLVSAAVLLPSVIGLVVLGIVFPPGQLTAEQVERINELNAQQDALQNEPQTTPVEATGKLNQGIVEALSAVSWPENLIPSLDTVQVEGMPTENEARCSALEGSMCEFGPKSAPQMVVYGDSLGTTLMPTIRSAYERDHGIRGMTLAACAITDLDVTWKSGQEQAWCLEHRKRIRVLVEETAPDVVLVIQNYAWMNRLASGATGAAAAEEWRGADDALESDLLKLGAGKVVFVSPPPEGRSIIDCGTLSSSPADCETPIPDSWMTIQEAQAASGSLFLDEIDWFCADGKCPALNGNVVVRRDNVHPTRQYAEALGDEFRERLDTILGR